MTYKLNRLSFEQVLAEQATMQTVTSDKLDSQQFKDSNRQVKLLKQPKKLQKVSKSSFDADLLLKERSKLVKTN